MNVKRFIKLGILTLLLAGILSSFSPLHGNNVYWLGLFPLIGAFTGPIGHIVFTIVSYAFIPETGTQFILMVILSSVALIAGHLLSDYYNWVNFRILTLIFSAVIILEGIFKRSIEGEVTIFNVFISIVLFSLWNAYCSWKERRDYKEHLAANEIPSTVQVVNFERRVSLNNPAINTHNTPSINTQSTPIQHFEPATTNSTTNNINSEDVINTKNDEPVERPIPIDPSNGSFEQEESGLRQWIYK